jgi:hypothetical protein
LAECHDHAVSGFDVLHRKSLREAVDPRWQSDAAFMKCQPGFISTQLLFQKVAAPGICVA